MNRKSLIFLGLLSYFPALVAVAYSLFGVVALVAYSLKDPPVPPPVLGLPSLVIFGTTLLICVILAVYFARLPVVAHEQRMSWLILMLLFPVPCLPWFWHTMLWKQRAALE